MALYLFVFVAIWSSVMSSSSVVRVNYGVLFRHVADIDSGERTWFHTFHIPLPDADETRHRLLNLIDATTGPVKMDPAASALINVINDTTQL